MRKSTFTPTVFAVARAITEMVIAAPAMLTVAPRGMEIEYVSSSRPSSLQSSILTGILAAELLVKNAVIKLPFRHLNTSGKGFCFVKKNTTIGLMTSATTAILPTNTIINFPYPRRTPSPCWEITVKIRPMIPNGAKLMIHLTAVAVASEIFSNAVFVPSLAAFRAIPKMIAQNKIPI